MSNYIIKLNWLLKYEKSEPFSPQIKSFQLSGQDTEMYLVRKQVFNLPF